MNMLARSLGAEVRKCDQVLGQGANVCDALMQAKPGLDSPVLVLSF